MARESIISDSRNFGSRSNLYFFSYVLGTSESALLVTYVLSAITVCEILERVPKAVIVVCCDSAEKVLEPVKSSQGVNSLPVDLLKELFDFLFTKRTFWQECHCVLHPFVETRSLQFRHLKKNTRGIWDAVSWEI